MQGWFLLLILPPASPLYHQYQLLWFAEQTIHSWVSAWKDIPSQNESPHYFEENALLDRAVWLSKKRAFIEPHK